MLILSGKTRIKCCGKIDNGRNRSFRNSDSTVIKICTDSPKFRDRCTSIRRLSHFWERLFSLRFGKRSSRDDFGTRVKIFDLLPCALPAFRIANEEQILEPFFQPFSRARTTLSSGFSRNCEIGNDLNFSRYFGFGFMVNWKKCITLINKLFGLNFEALNLFFIKWGSGIFKLWIYF